MTRPCPRFFERLELPRPDVNLEVGSGSHAIQTAQVMIRFEEYVQDKHPEVVTRLTRLLEQYVTLGRSTPGQPQKNAVPVDFWKAGKEAHRPLWQKRR